MLKEQYQDPLSQFFQTGVEECIKYQRKVNPSSKSRSQKLKEKIIRSSEHKKQKRKQRRFLEKKKLHEILSSMTQQQKRIYLDSIKLAKQQKKQRVRKAMANGQIIILDLVFESKMNNKQNKSLANQIQLIMKAIKYVKQPPSIHLCNFKDGIKEQLEKMRYQFWPLTAHEEDASAFIQGIKGKVIYLSPDAEDTLETVNTSKNLLMKDNVFILGGLIDRTIIKNASLMRARDLGVECRRLPINQYMKGRACLNLDHVISMVCKYKETGSWKEAFQFAAPKRWKKSGVQEGEKEKDEGEQESEQESEEGEDEEQVKGQDKETKELLKEQGLHL